MTVGVIRPRRSLGQNFLRDNNIARKIIASFDPGVDDLVVEIGPGEGVLTSFLAGRVRRLIAVEVDPRAAGLLLQRFNSGSVQVLREDFLQFDLSSTAKDDGGPLRVLGNIPYNITTPILFHILDNRSAVKDALLMMQKEVAERIIASPGSKAYGIPSVFCQIFCTVEKLFDVSPNVFHPRPSVTSSLVRLTPLMKPRFTVRSERFFREMTRAVFGQRRKTLRNSLKAFLGEEADVGTSGIDLGRRPEECPIETLADLSNALFEQAGRRGTE